jgi:hypothetical protein
LIIWSPISRIFNYEGLKTSGTAGYFNHPPVNTEWLF